MADRTVRSALALGVVCALFAVTILSVPLLEAGATPALAALVAVGAFALAVWKYRDRRAGDESSERSAIWDAIPTWQYSGRHAESGGMTRDEQERALADVRRRASRVERYERK